MAGRGRAPKDASRRTNRHPPARGEWIDLPELREPVIPDLPADQDYTHHAEATWLAWQQDRATTQWGPSEIAFARETIYLIDSLHRKVSSVLAAEIRQRMDGLGLTPKGKRDLRWRVPEKTEAEVVDLPTPEQRERKVRAVEA